MPSLIKIGQSQGIKIPNLLIEQAHLKNRELQLKVVTEGILISPVPKPPVREGWKESIEAILKEPGSEAPNHEWLDAPLVSNEKWEW
jgi:antitoxin MazE